MDNLDNTQEITRMEFNEVTKQYLHDRTLAPPSDGFSLHLCAIVCSLLNGTSALLGLRAVGGTHNWRGAKVRPFRPHPFLKCSLDPPLSHISAYDVIMNLIII